MNRCGILVTLGLAAVIALTGCHSPQPVRRPAIADGCEVWQGGIIRGPTDEQRIAFVFTGHGYAEGADTILNELARHQAHGSFFLTGTFLTNRTFKPLVKRMQAEGHYLGPHSDAHLLYCEWAPARKTLVTQAEFRADLKKNLAKLPGTARYFLPPFEHYNANITAWSADLGLTLINYTPGTRSNADYTGEADHNFVSSQKIFDSILKHERDDPRGLNGFILLLHVGSGPGRADKFPARFGELLDTLASKGYQFVRVDELLQTTPDARP